MSELDPTKRTFGVTDEGLWLLCCDCIDPSDYQSVGCECLTSAKLWAVTSPGVELSSGTWVYTNIVDVDYWASREFIGQPEYYVKCQTLSGGGTVPPGTVKNPDNPIIVYHTPDPAWEETYSSQGCNPTFISDTSSQVPEVIFTGKWVSQELAAVAQQALGPLSGETWTYLRSYCNLGSQKFFNNVGVARGGHTVESRPSIVTIGASYLRPNLENTDATTYIYPEIKNSSLPFDNDGNVLMAGRTYISQDYPTYSVGDGTSIRSPALGEGVPSGLPSWNVDIDEPGYVVACPEGSERTQVFGHVEMEKWSDDGPNFRSPLGPRLRIPRLIRMTIGGHTAIVPALRNSFQGGGRAYENFIAEFRGECINGWEGNAMYQGGWFEQATTDYSIGGINAGSAPMQGGPAAWDASPYQGRPIYDNSNGAILFYPARPMSGFFWSRLTHSIAPPGQYSNNCDWTAATGNGGLYMSMQVGFQEEEYHGEGYGLPWKDRRRRIFALNGVIGTVGGTADLPDEENSYLDDPCYGGQVAGVVAAWDGSATSGSGSCPVYYFEQEYVRPAYNKPKKWTTIDATIVKNTMDFSWEYIY